MHVCLYLYSLFRIKWLCENIFTKRNDTTCNLIQVYAEMQTQTKEMCLSYSNVVDFSTFSQFEVVLRKYGLEAKIHFSGYSYH